MKPTIYTCPVCGQRLTEEARRAVCPRGHSFDRAKEGYFHLLPSSRGGVHGDNREMILSRKHFLESGYYDGICERVCEQVMRHMPPGGVLLDEGAGEGYYTIHMAQALDADGRDASVFAFDISKEAVRLAARRSPMLRMAVAGVYHIPVAPGSVDVAVNMFAPLSAEQTWQVLREGGVFLLVVPEREHLFSFKEVLYDTPYKNTVSDSALDGFALLSTEEVLYDICVQGAHLPELLRMTPYGYRTPRAGWERLMTLRELRTTVHVRLYVYQKTSPLEPKM